MAEPKPTSGVAPLSEAEQKQLDDLTARRDAAAAAAADQARQDKLASLASVDALLKLVSTDKVRAATDAVLADTAVDFATKQLVTNFRQSLDYNLGALATQLADLSKPAVAA